MLIVKMSITHIEPGLRAYVAALPRGGVSALADRIGVHPVYLSQLAAAQDGRRPSPQLAVAIERATEGAVTRRELRPDDWWLIWPELIDEAHPAPVEVRDAA